jgi:hypothetical protein
MKERVIWSAICSNPTHTGSVRSTPQLEDIPAVSQLLVLVIWRDVTKQTNQLLIGMAQLAVAGQGIHHCNLLRSIKEPKLGQAMERTETQTPPSTLRTVQKPPHWLLKQGLKGTMSMSRES